MGSRGQGRGGRASEKQARMGFKIERDKVHTQKGAIIARFLVEGDQIRGEVDRSFAEIISAAEREASDRINRDRIPRQYHKAIKDYFSNVQRSLRAAKALKRDGPVEEARPGAADEPANQSQDQEKDKD